MSLKAFVLTLMVRKPDILRWRNGSFICETRLKSGQKNRPRVLYLDGSRFQPVLCDGCVMDGVVFYIRQKDSGCRAVMTRCGA